MKNKKMIGEEDNERIEEEIRKEEEEKRGEIYEVMER